MKRLWCCYLISLLAILGVLFNGKDSAAKDRIKTDSQIKAEFILNYIPYITWPKRSIKNNKILICVIGRDSVTPYLQDIENEAVQHFIVKEKRKRSDITECNIVFISKKNEEEVDYVLSIVKKLPIFTISDMADFADKGGIAEFQINDTKGVYLQMNIRSAGLARLEIDPDLLAIMNNIIE